MKSILPDEPKKQTKAKEVKEGYCKNFCLYPKKDKMPLKYIKQESAMICILKKSSYLLMQRRPKICREASQNAELVDAGNI